MWVALPNNPKILSLINSINTSIFLSKFLMLSRSSSMILIPRQQPSRSKKFFPSSLTHREIENAPTISLASWKKCTKQNSCNRLCKASKQSVPEFRQKCLSNKRGKSKWWWSMRSIQFSKSLRKESIQIQLTSLKKITPYFAKFLRKLKEIQRK